MRTAPTTTDPKKLARREYYRKYMREYRAKHPAHTRYRQLQDMAAYLRKRGFIVTQIDTEGQDHKGGDNE